ncbi:MAG: hypothetical protein BMS9Abin36_2277 [Gammaproteobacteria bacterium]|nr:MAG: hypothetical protein BMS9Abin36_2277 [Gammaproteobacteria bacterium]
MLIISDSNIFIDMEVGGLTRRIFQLPESIGTPNVLYDEELAIQHPELPVLGLLILDVQTEYMLLADRWQDCYPDPTFNDLSAMALAKQEQCPLLTGDKQLRIAAACESIEVHGTLWLMERMYGEGIINLKRSEQAYAEMLRVKRRLPWDEVEKQISKWKK